MATVPPSTTKRDANLDALQRAVDEWANKEIARLDNEVKFMNAVLKGRGASKAGTENLLGASKLVQKSIDDFVTVG